MKKRALTIFTTLVSAASIVTAVAVTKSDESIFKISGQDEPSVFYLDYSTVESIDDDTYQVTLRNQTGGSVRVNVKGARYNDNYLYADGKNEFYLYNIDPIRGINGVGVFLTDEHKGHSLNSQKMFSYNQIDYNEVLKGKYQDLSYTYLFHNYEYQFSDTVMPQEVPELISSRYFLFHYDFNYNYDNTLKIESIAFMTVCNEEPQSVPVGENLGVLNEQDLENLSTVFKNSIELESVGNPAYGWNMDNSEPSFFQYVNKDEEPALIQQILNQGFNLTFSFESRGYYQKKEGSKVHTIGIEIKEGQYSNRLNAYYTDQIEYFENFTSWPEQYINDFLDEDHKNTIPVMSSEIIEQFKIVEMKVSTMENPGDSNILVIKPVFDGECTEEIANAILEAYLPLFDTSLWNIEHGECEFHDGFLFVGFYYYQGECIVEIGQAIRKYAPPTPSEIAEALGIDSSEGICSVSGGEGAVYIGSGSSYQIYDKDPKAYNNAMNQLHDAGFYSSYIGETSAEYYKVLNLFGDTLRVHIGRENTEGASSFYINYQYNRGNRSQVSSFADIVKMFGQYSPDMVNEIANAIEEDSSYEYYIVSGNYTSNNRNYGIIMNAGAEFISQFKTALSDYYIEAYDVYRFENRDNCIKLIDLDGAVKVTCTYYPNLQFYDYTVFNGLFSNFVNQSMISSDFIIELSEDDNLGTCFYYPGFDYGIYYYGSEEKVRSFEQLLIQRIKDNGNYTYSTYLNEYIATDGMGGLGISINFVNNGDYCNLNIRLSYENEFVDYKSYNELNLEQNSLLSNFPSFIEESDKDEKYFVILSESENSLSCEVKAAAELNERYLSVLAQAGFEQMDYSTFGKFIDGYLYTLSFSYNYSHKTYQVTFTKDGPYMTHDELFDSIGTTNAQYLNTFGFSECFNSTTPAYNVECFDMDHTVLVSNPTEVSNYVSYLLSNGYEYVNNDQASIHNSYVKTNESKDSFQIVTINTYGSTSAIQFNTRTMSFSSWDEIKDAMCAVHKYEENKDYVVYPDDGEGDLYSYMTPTSSDIVFAINKNYDIDAYKQRILNDENFDYYDEKSDSLYVFNDGTVSITDCYFYYQVSVHCNYYAGSSFNKAIPVEEGCTEISIRGPLTYYEFVPEKTATYTIYADSPEDSYGYLYNSNQDELISDDDSNGNRDFRFQYKLTAGETYYIGVRLYSTGDSCIYEGKLFIENSSYDGDSFESAINVSEGTTDVLIRRTTTYFEFTPESSGEYYLIFSSEEYMYIALYNSSLSYISSSGNSGSVYLSANLEEGESYYITVHGDSSSTYNGALQIIKEGSISYDGDSMENAIELAEGPLDVTFRKSSTFYKFECTESGQYVVQLVCNSAGGYFYIYDENGNSLYDSYFSGTSTFSCYLEEGYTYYLRTSLESYDNPFYTCEGTLQIGIPNEHNYDGSNMYSPVSINLGENTVDFRSFYTYFEFTPKESGHYYFTTEESPSNNATLYDSNGCELIYDAFSGENNQFCFGYELVAGEKYYLRAAINDYKPFDVCEVTLIVNQYEPEVFDGNTVDNAILINSDSIDVTYRSDVTYYKLQTSESGFYVISGSVESYYFGGIIYLYDSEGNQINTQYTTYNQPLVAQLDTNSTYYIGIELQSNNPFTSYEGSLNVGYISHFDGDSTTSAFSINLDEEFEIDMQYISTYYTITPEVSGLYILDVSQQSGYEYMIHVVESEGNISFGYDYFYGSTSYELKLDAGKTYYYQIKILSEDPYSIYPATATMTYLTYPGDSISNAMSAEVGSNEVTYIGRDTYYAFTATESGYYSFTSVCDSDTKAYLFNSEGNQIAYSDDDGEDYNFLFDNVYLEVGQTIYINARLFSSDKGAEYPGYLIISQIVE